MANSQQQPQYKSEAWLMKMGWSRGDGLGKERSGRTEIIQVVKRDEGKGVHIILTVESLENRDPIALVAQFQFLAKFRELGRQDYQLKDFSHWDDLFNKAAKKLDVHEHAEGVKIVKTIKEEVKVEEPKPTPYGNMFVKATTVTMVSTKKDYSEKDLFKICGSRELRLYGQNGKHDRLTKFDKGELNYTEPTEILKNVKDASSSDSSDSSKSEKSSKTSKKSKKNKNSEKEESHSSSDSDSSESEVKKSKKKSKKSKKASSSEESSSSESSEESSSSSSSSSSKRNSKRYSKKSKSKRKRSESSSDSSSESSEERPKKKSKK